MTRELKPGGELITVGYIKKAQGRKGEVALKPVSHDPGRFDGLDRVYLDGTGSGPRAYRLEWVRQHKGQPIVKFHGVSAIDDAQKLAGQAVQLPLAELEPLEEGRFFHFELRGCSVWDKFHGHLGEVTSVMETGGVDLLVVNGVSGQEVLIPLCNDICRKIDPDSRRIELQVPEGLVGLNAN